MFFGSLPNHCGSTRYRDCLPLWQSAYGSTSFVRMGSPLNPTSAFNAGRLYMVSNKLQDCSTNIYTRSSNDTTALNLSDSWVYFRLTSSTFSLLVVVVNNILHVVSNQDIIDSFSESMSKTYKFKNLGHPPLIVGMRITFTPSSLRLDQTHYIRQLGESFSQLDTTPVHYPESPLWLSWRQRLRVLHSPGHFPLFLSLSGWWPTLGYPHQAWHYRCGQPCLPTLVRPYRWSLEGIYPCSSLPDYHCGTLNCLSSKGVTPCYVDTDFANESNKLSRYGHPIYQSQCLIW